MNLTNTRPLMDSSISPASGFGGSMRRNASGILAGENIENWLQQTYNESDLRASAPQALMQDFNQKVHGEPRDYQIDHQGHFSRYNDAYRDRMLDGLDNLKSSYGRYGGKDASFVNQVRDMENYMHFNRPPPLNPLAQSVPYLQNGPATTFARQAALPPPVTIGYPYPGYMGPGLMYPNFVDHDRRMLRTHLISQKQTINELQEELNGVRREGQRFEDVLHKSHQDVHKLHSSHFPGQYLSNGIDTMDPRKSTVKWGDAETDKTLNSLALKEQELIRTLSKLPENSDMFKTKRAKLDELVRQRTEIERMLYSKADYKNYLHEKVVDDQKKDNLAQWLRRDLELFRIDKTDEDFIDRKFRPSAGFLVYWDYILNLTKEFRQVQVVYGIYNRGMTMFEPRLVPLTDTIDTTHPSFCQAIFAVNHLVRDIEAHPDIVMIMEIQVPAHRNTRPAKKSGLDSGPHTGYLLSRFGKIQGSGGYEYGDPENAKGYDDQIDTGVFQTYGWTVLDLFNFKNDLKRGTYKLPIYKPPTIINLDVRDIPQLERIKDTMVWMRIAYPREDEINEVRCEPAYYHIYYVPEIHNIAPKVTMHLKPERDPTYSCDGIQVFLHWTKGYTMNRFVRITCAMQVGKDILLEDNGRLCFYTSKGLFYPKPKSRAPNLSSAVGTGVSNKIATAINTANNAKLNTADGSATPSSVPVRPEKPLTAAKAYHDDKEKTVYFNEQKTWYKDLYNMIWDLDLEENIYLILQYNELKPEIENPTGHTVMSRQVIEEEYDIVGYTILMLNNPDGTIRYGSYILDLYDGPIYVEELDALKRNECQMKITIAKPGEFVPYNEGPAALAAKAKTPKTAQSVADGDSQVGTPKAPPSQPPGILKQDSRVDFKLDKERPLETRQGGRRNRDEDDGEQPRSRRRTGSRDRDEDGKPRSRRREGSRDRGSRDRRDRDRDGDREERKSRRRKSRDEDPEKPRSRRREGGSRDRRDRDRRSRDDPDKPRSRRRESRDRDPDKPRSRRREGSRGRSRDDDPDKPRSRRRTGSRDRERSSRRGEPRSPAERNFKRRPTDELADRRRPKSKGKKKKKNRRGPRQDYSYGDEDDYDIFDRTAETNDKIGSSLDPQRRRLDNYFIVNDLPQNTGQPFPNSGIDFYVDGARFLPDNVTVSKIQVTSYLTDHTKVSVSAGGLADLDMSTTFNHYYGFRYEFRLPKFQPQTCVVITIYTIDRTSNQVRTLGYSCIHLFLNKITLLPCDNPKDKDFVLQEGMFQLPIYIEDPRKLPEIRAEALNYLERLPCASLLVRVLRAPIGSNGSILSAKTVPQNQWLEKGVVVPAPDYNQGVYNTYLCPVSDVELELFPTRAERGELQLRETADQLMQALTAQRTNNQNTLLDWLEQKLSVESEDPPLMDLKYFATYDPDFGFKLAVDGIHNLPKRMNVFYVVVVSLNPPASMYTSSKIPTSDVNLVSTYDWDSSIISVRFLDNYFYYQDVKPDAQMSVVFEVMSIEFVNGIPRVETVAWSAIPVFFIRYGNYYVRSGAFQVPLFRGKVEYAHLQNMYNFDDPWNYLAQRLNERSLQLWDGISLVVRMVDSQREGHYSRPFDFDRFNLVYIPEAVMQKLNYAYTGATEARLRTTPKLLTMVPPNMDRIVFQEAVNRTFNNMLGLSRFR